MNRGLSIIELLLALAISGLVAAGVAAMLGGVAAGIAVGTDARTGMLASGVIQGRVVEAVAPGACVLASTETATAIWLGDTTPGGNVEPSECAWIVFDALQGILTIERVVFPDSWGMIERAKFDRPLRPNSDPFPILLEARNEGIAEADILADSVLAIELPSGTTLINDTDLRMDLQLELPTGAWEMTATTVFSTYDTPREWKP